MHTGLAVWRCLLAARCTIQPTCRGWNVCRGAALRTRLKAKQSDLERLRKQVRCAVLC